MNDAFVVGRRQSAGDLQGKVHGFAGRERAIS